MTSATTQDDEIVAPLLESATDFLAGVHSPARCKSSVGVPPRVDAAMWRRMAELGWTGLTLSESLGGSGLSLSVAAALSELFGRELVPEPLTAASVMPCAVLASAEGPVAKDVSQALLSGERVVTLAWQSRAGQIDIEKSGVRLVNGRLHGRAEFVPVLADGGIVLVWAQSADAPVIAATRAGVAGVNAERHAAGITAIATLTFDGAEILGGVPLQSGVQAERALQSALTAGTVCAAAQLAGLGAGALQKTIDYVSNRIQFGRPIGSFQSIQHRCADLYIELQLARASWRAAARTGSVRDVAAAKARCGDAAVKVGREAVQMHGAIGFTEEAAIGLYLRAALHVSSWLGTPLLQRRRFMLAT